MNDSSNYLQDWWRWWGNPLVSIHSSQVIHLPYATELLKQPSYLLFLELRGSLALPDTPDAYLIERPQLRSLALAEQEEISETFVQAATLSLGPNILQASAQKWSQHFGVDSPEQVRQIIQWRHEIPHALKAWRESLLITLNQGDSYNMHMHTRALLCVGAYLQSFYPNFYKRFQLTLPFEITLILKSVDLIPQEAQASCESWFEPMLVALHERVLLRYPSDDIEPFDLQEDEETETLAKLDETNPWQETSDA
ncbi:hypothetical protein [Limnobacter sp.]|uniref:hypothetical protein n=1 Tax=Limnobacter sp. TaxID=2003368 RepID=UPI003516C8D3